MRLITLLSIFLFSYSSFAQNNGCPDKNQKNYNCGNIEENVFEGISNPNYEIKTQFEFKLKQNLKRKKDIEKAIKVTELVNNVLNDNDFWVALRFYQNYKYAKWSKYLNEDWQNIEDQQIINAFINGNPNNEIYPENINLEIEMKLYGWSFAWPFETAVAKEGNGIIYNKRWFFRKDSIVNIGSNWVHEIAHSKGLRHCFKCNEDRDYSIPYIINRIFKQVAKKYI